MGLSSVLKQVIKDGVLLNLEVPEHCSRVRAEVQRFAQEMRTSRGSPIDIPPMIYSAVPLAPSTQRSCASNFSVLILSIGGTNTNLRWITSHAGELHLEALPLGLTPADAHFNSPCNDNLSHGALEFVEPIAQKVLRWLTQIPLAQFPQHLVISWGFPQLNYALPKASGITGAIACGMSKGQSGVAITDAHIEELFRQLLADLASGNACMALRKPLQQLRISVQNDTIMAVHRYLEAENRQKFHKIGLMILGTGVNVTTAEPFVLDQRGRVLEDSEGFAMHAVQPEARKQSVQDFWICYEAGRLQVSETRAKCDRLHPVRDKGIVADIEELGLGGIGFPRIFANLIRDYMPAGERVLEFVREEVGELNAHRVCDIAKAKLMLQSDRITPVLAAELQELAQVTLYRGILRAAEVLSAVSLYSGLGLHQGEQADALALEGSLWTIPDFQTEVVRLWNKLLQNELGEAGLEKLNLVLLHEDDYNASLMGPAYFIRQFDAARR